MLSFLSQAAYEEKDWVSLERLSSERLEINPDDIHAINYLCSWALHQCHWEKLDALVDIRLKKDPHDLRAYTFLCQKGTAQKDWKYVEEQALKMQGFDSDDFFTNHYLFLCYVRSERVEEAKAILAKLEEVTEKNNLFIHRVELLVASRSFDGAINLIREADPKEKNDFTQRLLVDLVDSSFRENPIAYMLNKIAADLRDLANQVVRKPQVVASASTSAGHDVSATAQTAQAAL